jgi:hypothetical protein
MVSIIYSLRSNNYTKREMVGTLDYQIVTKEQSNDIKHNQPVIFILRSFLYMYRSSVIVFH